MGEVGRWTPFRHQLALQPFRGGRTMTAVSGSSGLGLWISLGLARRMGGDLTYQRQSGQTLFELILPAADFEPESPQLQSPRSPTPRSTEYAS